MLVDEWFQMVFFCGIYCKSYSTCLFHHFSRSRHWTYHDQWSVVFLEWQDKNLLKKTWRPQVPSIHRLLFCKACCRCANRSHWGIHCPMSLTRGRDEIWDVLRFPVIFWIQLARLQDPHLARCFDKFRLFLHNLLEPKMRFFVKVQRSLPQPKDPKEAAASSWIQWINVSDTLISTHPSGPDTSSKSEQPVIVPIWIYIYLKWIQHLHWWGCCKVIQSNELTICQRVEGLAYLDRFLMFIYLNLLGFEHWEVSQSQKQASYPLD